MSDCYEKTGLEVGMSLLLSKHERNCTCSYCGNGYNKRMRYGLNIPPDWNKWNAWYVIKFWPNTYLRWTNSWMKKIWWVKDE